MPLDDDELLRISRIATNWPLVRQAHQGPAEERPAAREELLNRYGQAVRAYLLGALRDSDAADEVFQEFALRVVRGDFHRADPTFGKFRNFVKAALYHLMVDHRRRQHHQPRSLDDVMVEPAAESADLDRLDAELMQTWREELLVRAWQQLDQAERDGGPRHHSVLRLRLEHPDLKSGQLAALLGERLGKPVTAANYRQILDRGRHRLAELLVDMVASARRPRTQAELLDLLGDLGLRDSCLHAAAQWQPP
jgi:RNA polymerase sigma-70 factor (ECF subfamily)